MADDADKAAEQGAATPEKSGASPAEQGLADAIGTLVVNAKAVVREKVMGVLEGILAALDEGSKKNEKSEK